VSGCRSAIVTNLVTLKECCYLFGWFLGQLLDGDPVQALLAFVVRRLVRRLLTFVDRFFVDFGRRNVRRKWRVWADWWWCGRVQIWRLGL